MSTNKNEGLLRKAGLCPDDNWKHRGDKMRCYTCMWFVFKEAAHVPFVRIGRCRRHAPTMSGWPVMYSSDWCGDHKLDESKL